MLEQSVQRLPDDIEELKRAFDIAQSKIEVRHEENRELISSQHENFMQAILEVAKEAKEDRHYLVNLMQSNVNAQAVTNSQVAKELGHLSGSIEGLLKQ